MIFRYITLFFIFFSTLLFAYPKIYSSATQDVYKDLKPISTLSHIKVMKPMKSEMIEYVSRANKEMKLGYWLDRNKAHPDAKAKSRVYLKEIRYLAHQNKLLAEFIANSTLDIIYADKPRSFNAIMKSKHRIFVQDKELRIAIKKYRKKLHKRDLKRSKIRSSKEKQDAIKKQKFYRSAKHLKGVWIDKNGSNTTFIFIGKTLTMQVKSGKSQQKIIGTFQTTMDTLTFTIKTIVRYDREGIEHQRHTNIVRKYTITKAGKKVFHLKFQTTKYKLVKQK